ncbi:hypothetical protein AK812_SmicGene23274 [Symbiodinium microadriaticum]|uniref:Uncharacterized protein n=1 Tax=Symbiodinium microadriaticum TaxID=2951 RepID=A0A1Q9DHM2_SYMMI|nr:hypothetical protein AK812_SmicGene23274 [Symbiodinium microadriaticum]
MGALRARMGKRYFAREVLTDSEWGSSNDDYLLRYTMEAMGFTQIFVSHLVLRRIGAVLSTLPIKPVDVHTGPPAAERGIHGDLEAKRCKCRTGRVCNHSKQPQRASADEGVEQRADKRARLCLFQPSMLAAEKLEHRAGRSFRPLKGTGPTRVKVQQEVQSRLGQGLGSQVIDEEFGIAVSTASAIRVLRGVEAEVSAWQSLALLCQVDAE